MLLLCLFKDASMTTHEKVPPFHCGMGRQHFTRDVANGEGHVAF